MVIYHQQNQVWVYISKHVGKWSYTRGLDKIRYFEDQPINTNQLDSM